MKLAEMQRLFYQLAARTSGSDSVDPDALFAGTADLDAKARIGIYADMFVWRQIDALRDDFPRLARLLGDGPFYAMAEQYLKAHPSRHPSLSELGRELPRFLHDWRGPGGRGDLGDLATLEWARAKVFEDANVEPVPADLLRTFSADVLPRIRLRFVPALRVVRLRHDFAALWDALEEGSTAGPPAPRRQTVVVWRKGFDVLHAPIEKEETAALASARSGEALGAVCEAFAGRSDGVEAAFAAISSWFVEGWIAEAR